MGRCYDRHEASAQARRTLASAWPILKVYGFRAVVFLVTKQIGGVNFWDREKGEPQEPLLNMAQVKALALNGIEFGSHSHSHHDLTQLPLSAVESDVRASKAVLEGALGIKIAAFSYPYGKLDKFGERDIKIVRNSGFTTAVTAQCEHIDKNHNIYRLPRIPVYNHDNVLRLKNKLSSMNFIYRLFNNIRK